MIDERIAKKEKRIADIEQEITDKVAEQIRHYGRPLGHKVLSDKLKAAQLQLEKLKSKKLNQVASQPLVKKDLQTIKAIRENRKEWNTSTKGKVSWDNRYAGSRSQRATWKRYFKD